MKVYVFTRRKDEICFGHYNKEEIAGMKQEGWRLAHHALLEKWTKPVMPTRRLNNKQQIGVNKHGLPIYK